MQIVSSLKKRQFAQKCQSLFLVKQKCQSLFLGKHKN